MLEPRRVETGGVPAAPPSPPPVFSLAGIYVPAFQSQRGAERVMSGTDPKGPTLLRYKYVSGGADML